MHRGYHLTDGMPRCLTTPGTITSTRMYAGGEQSHVQSHGSEPVTCWTALPPGLTAPPDAVSQ